MKNHLLKTVLPAVLLIAAIFIIGSGCSNPPPAPNEDECVYSGFKILETTNNTETLIPEVELTTDFYYTSSNGPEVEIYKTSNPGSFWFITTAVVANATGTGTLSIGGVNYPVNVICKKTGNAVGQGMRFEISGTGIEADYCGVIDVYH